MSKFSGPMFEPTKDEHRKSIYDKHGGHYNIYATHSPDAALAMLRQLFPKGSEPNEMNLVFFSTSGVHGMYTAIEEIEADIRKHGNKERDPDDEDCDRPLREVTFLLVQPRIVGMTYGNCACRTLDDARFLKRLRAASWKAAGKVGAPTRRI